MCVSCQICCHCHHLILRQASIPLTRSHNAYGIVAVSSLAALKAFWNLTPRSPVSAAWEVTPADQTQYWEQVPDNVKLTLHYYNVPCSIEPDSEFNPLRIVKTLYQPGDFVVIKVSACGHTMLQGFAAVVIAVCVRWHDPGAASSTVCRFAAENGADSAPLPKGL